MNILQFNVRLAEGGAAGVALDLHQRALQKGLQSRFIYGYAKAVRKASATIAIRRCTSRRHV
ncbi:glycosyl transferase family protein [Enterobacter cloacae]|uniref:Glycosyl transferase family protein n=1 Tax=Enterobacter cloacae TaxID=550 RepID=A0A377LX33_ENTCL|nr:glycosyl transferase family protein [Enterobacter cloacae]